MVLQDKHNMLYRLVLDAMLVSVALILSYIESFIPLSFLYIVPGLKLGLANIPVVFAVYNLSVRDGIAVAAMKIALTALLFGSPVSFLFSLMGTVFSLTIMISLKKFFTKKKLTFIGVSCICAAFFNIGQLTAAAFIFKSLSPLFYLPSLIIGGAIFGILCGVLLNLTSALLQNRRCFRQFKH